MFGVYAFKFVPYHPELSDLIAAAFSFYPQAICFVTRNPLMCTHLWICSGSSRIKGLHLYAPRVVAI